MCDFVLVLCEPALRVAILVAPKSVIVPPPLIAVATRKKLKKEFPVETLPILETGDENVVDILTVAVVGVTAPAVKSAARETHLLTLTSQLVPVSQTVETFVSASLLPLL